jgi:NAD(P)H-dependent FMN reductase
MRRALSILAAWLLPLEELGRLVEALDTLRAEDDAHGWGLALRPDDARGRGPERPLPAAPVTVLGKPWTAPRTRAPFAPIRRWTARRAHAYLPRMVQILVICGSLQRVSANRAALDVAQARLAAGGVRVETFADLAAIPPMNPDHGDDPGPAVLRLRAQLHSADAVLLAAPEYAGAIVGVVKNALDWIVGSGELHGKPVGLLSAGTSGGVFARRDLVRTLCWQGAHVVASLGIAGPGPKSVAEADGARRFTDAATIAEIEALASSLAAAVAQRPSERLAAVTSLARDAGVDPGPLAEHLAAQEERLDAEGRAGDEAAGEGAR